MSTKVEKIVEFEIHRFDPKTKRRYVSTYKVPIRKGMTLLDTLMYIRDNTLTEHLRSDPPVKWEFAEAAAYK